MALPVQQFPLLTPDQISPMMTGMSQANQLYQQNMQNKYLQSNLQADLKQKQLANQIAQAQANVAPQMSAAQLAYQQAKTPNLNAATTYMLGGQLPEAQAQAGYVGALGNLINQTTPYKVQQSQGQVYTDPILSRLYQLTQANKTHTISPSLLRNVGMGDASQNLPNNPNSSMPNLGSYAQNPSQVSLPPSQILPPNPYSGSAGTPSTTTAPNMYSGDAMQNWALFGSPINPIDMTQLSSAAKTQGTTGVTQWNDTQNSAQTAADLGYQLQNFATQFQNGYKNSRYKGPVEGRVPVTGLVSGLVPGNLTAEQITDNASQNAAALVAKLIAGGRVTNYEMQYMNTLKPNRSMTGQAAQMTSDFLIQRAKQMQEFPQFLNAAQSEGLDVHTAQNLWNMYRNQRPVYDFGENKPNTQFDGSWRQFLNPQAVMAARNGTPYVSIPPGYIDNKTEFLNWYKTLNPQDRVLAKEEYLNGGQ